METGVERAGPVELAARALLSRAKDSRTKLVGLDTDLVSLASALQSLEIGLLRLELELVQLSVRVDRGEAFAPVLDLDLTEHPNNCECRECCLRRMVAFAATN